MKYTQPRKTPTSKPRYGVLCNQAHQEARVPRSPVSDHSMLPLRKVEQEQDGAQRKQKETKKQCPSRHPRSFPNEIPIVAEPHMLPRFRFPLFQTPNKNPILHRRSHHLRRCHHHGTPRPHRPLHHHAFSACPSFSNISSTICPPATSGWLMQILTVPLESCCAPTGGCTPARPAPPPPAGPLPVGPRNP